MDLRRPLGIAIRRGAYRLAGLFKPPRDEAFKALLRSVKDLALGRRPSVPDNTGTALSNHGLVVGPRVEPPGALPEDFDWSVPPDADTATIVRSIYDTGSAPKRYDVALLEMLNADYADRPIVPAPPSYEADARATAAAHRVKTAHARVDLRGKTVLEIGCGEGFVTWLVGTDMSSAAYGVDVQQRDSWKELAGEHVRFFCADMSQANPFSDEMFDRVISFAVWEHVLHPAKMLAETFKVMKSGGLAHIRANLYYGPMASHRYREIFFPWPHLLFSDDVIREWDAKNGRTSRGAAWVNRMSWDQYERCMAEAGFILRDVTFQTADWDEEFYRRFEDILGRIPRIDLSRDFFTAILQKP